MYPPADLPGLEFNLLSQADPDAWPTVAREVENGTIPIPITYALTASTAANLLHCQVAVSYDDMSGADSTTRTAALWPTVDRHARLRNSLPFHAADFPVDHFLWDLVLHLPDYRGTEQIRLWMLQGPRANLAPIRIFSTDQFIDELANFEDFFLKNPADRHWLALHVEKVEGQGPVLSHPDVIRRRRLGAHAQARDDMTVLISPRTTATGFAAAPVPAPASPRRVRPGPGPPRIAVARKPLPPTPPPVPPHRFLPRQAPPAQGQRRVVRQKTRARAPTTSSTSSGRSRLSPPPKIPSPSRDQQILRRSSRPKPNVVNKVVKKIFKQVDKQVEADAAKYVKTTVLSSLGADSSPVRNLEKLNDMLPISESPSEAEFAEICQYVRISPDDHRDPLTRSVKIPYSTMMATPLQLVTAFRMLTHRVTFGVQGGILADFMGSGKTYTTLLYVMLRAQIFENKRNVEHSWTLQELAKNPPPPRHCARDASARDAARCPSQREGCLTCYCVPDSWARRWAGRLAHGVSLIQVPTSVVQDFVAAVDSVELSRYPSVYTITVFSTNNTPKYAMRPAVKQDLRQHASLPDHAYYDADFEPTVYDADFSEMRGMHNNITPETFIFLTTHHSTQVEKAFQVPIQVRTVSGRPQTRFVFGLRIGVQIVDEFHQVLAPDSVALRYAAMAKHIGHGRGGFDFFGVSATPIKKLVDIEHLVRVLEQPDWDTTNRPETLFWFKTMTGCYAKATADDAGAAAEDDFREAFGHFFGHGLVLRTAEYSTFFGRPVTDVQDVEPFVVEFETPALLRREVAAAVHELFQRNILVIPGSRGRYAEAIRRESRAAGFHFLSTFPGAAGAILRGLDVSERGIRAHVGALRNRGDLSEVSAFVDLVDEISAHSPKLAFIRKEVQEMMMRSRSKKAVVITATLAEAVFVYLALLRLEPRCAPLCLHPDQLASEKAEVKRAFDLPPPAAAAGSRRHPRVLVTTFQLAGEGCNFQVASLNILTSPLRYKADEDQAFRRTNRQGQKLPVRHFRLLMGDSPVDRIRVLDHAGRDTVSNLFDINAEVRLKSVSGLVQVGLEP